MLRRMESRAALGRGMDWDRASALARRALGWAALMGVTFLLCRARAGRSAPFAMAFLAAALPLGRSAAALIAGCLAGAMRGTIRDFDLALPIGAAVALGGSIAWDFARPALRRMAARDDRAGRLLRRARDVLMGRRTGAFEGPAPNRLARSPNDAGAMLCAALAGAAVLIPGLALLGDGLSVPAAAQVTAAAVAAVAAAPFYKEAIEGGLSPRRWTAARRAGLWLLMGAACAGLARVSAPLGLCAGAALALLMYPAGALAGAAFGAAVAVWAGDGRLLALLAVGGATAQICERHGPIARAALTAGAMLVAGLLLNMKPVLLAGGPVAALGAMPVPEAWARFFFMLAKPELPGDPVRLAALERRRAAAKLNALAAAFGELAEGYMWPVTLPDEQALTRRLRGRLCAGCGDYGACWAGERNRGARFLCDLIARAAACGEDAPVFDGEVTPELLRRCRRARLLPERTEDLLEDFARSRRAELRRSAENRLVSAQFLQARQLLEALAGRVAQPPPRRRGPRLRVERGAACASGRAGEESGDSHLICMIDETRLLAVICDGMGSGPEAAEESRLAVRLLGRFLRAGAPCALAVETVNALLLNRGGEDMFATADLLILDLMTGEAEFMKLAACPTMIARGGEALRVEGGRLPLGILEQVRPEHTRARLMPGDAVLMVSDGVADAAGIEALEEMLVAGAGEDAARLSQRALDLAGAACDGGRRDDMTAVVLKINSFFTLQC